LTWPTRGIVIIVWLAVFASFAVAQLPDRKTEASREQQSPAQKAQLSDAEREKLIAQRDRLRDEARSLIARRNLKKAMPVAEELVSVWRKLGIGPDPDDARGFSDWEKWIAKTKKELAANAEFAVLLREFNRFADEANALERKGELEKAIGMAQQLIAIGKKLEDDPEVAKALANWRNWIANVTKELVADGERAMLIAERNRLADEAEAMAEKGELRRAIALAQEMLAVWRKYAPEPNESFCNWLAWIADKQEKLEDFAAAIGSRAQVLEIQSKLHGEKDWRVINARVELEHTRLVQRLSRQQRAELARAETIHDDAGSHHDTGDYARAVEMLDLCVAIRRRLLGETHPDTAASLNNLGGAYLSMGDYQRAEPNFQGSLKIFRKVYGEEHPQTASSLNNLAELYRSVGLYARAEALYQQSLEICRKALGEEHKLTALCLNNLGQLCGESGSYARAEPLLQQSLAIRRKLLGEVHRDTGTSLNNLACLYEVKGDYARAEPLFLKTLEIDRKTRGSAHPDTGRTLTNIGGLYFEMGDYARAEPYWRETLEHSQNHLSRTFAAQSERQQIRLSEALRYNLTNYLSLAPRAKVPAAAAYEHVLRWKGMVFTQQRIQRLERQRPELAPLFQQLQSVSSRLATLSLAVPDPRQHEGWLRQIEVLTDRQESLQRDIARQSAEFRRQQEASELTVAQLRQILPPKTALIDFLDYRRASPPKDGKTTLEYSQHLVAFVVRPDRDVVQVDLREVYPIHQSVEAWRQAILGGGGHFDDTSLQARLQYSENEVVQLPLPQMVRHFVWRPLEKHLDGIDTVLISPDGIVSRIPFAALPGSKPGQYLIQEKQLAIIAVPQELPGLLQSRRKKEGPEAPTMLLAGAVDFDAAPGRIQIATADDRARLTETSQRLQGAEEAATGQSRSGIRNERRTAARGSKAMTFKPLPGTKREIEVIGSLYQRRFGGGQPKLLQSGAATEDALRIHAPRHRYVHLATHGFFAPPEVRSAATSSQKPEVKMSLFGSDRDVSGFHPGLLCGLALAGANREAHSGHSVASSAGQAGSGTSTQASAVTNTPSAAEQDADDGILTAIEVAALDLTGVELVVLSACETGLGEVAGGEGVLGLQRAFQAAGARTAITSLWQVDDAATQTLMAEFYKNLWDRKLGPLQALQEAQMTMLERYDPRSRRLRGYDKAAEAQSRAGAPFYWAAFQLSGDWR
jgi:CHAT domain-containing protein/tetratricopeptide (TPR) repeat protein